MGWLSDAWEKAKDTVTKPLEKVVNGVGKMASGDFKEGFGDITSTAANVGLDIVTGGNKGKVDALTGGLMTSAENAARGNLKDGIRVGATTGATIFGGPAAGMAVNTAFANGGNIIDAGKMYATSQGFGGVANIASNALDKTLGISGNLGIGGPQVLTNVPSVSASPVQYTPSENPNKKDNTFLYIAMGGGFLMIILLIVLQRKK